MVVVSFIISDHGKRILLVIKYALAYRESNKLVTEDSSRYNMKTKEWSLANCVKMYDFASDLEDDLCYQNNKRRIKIVRLNITQEDFSWV